MSENKLFYFLQQHRYSSLGRSNIGGQRELPVLNPIMLGNQDVRQQPNQGKISIIVRISKIRYDCN